MRNLISYTQREKSKHYNITLVRVSCMGMMKLWKIERKDIVVCSYRNERKRVLTVCPKSPGHYKIVFNGNFFAEKSFNITQDTYSRQIAYTIDKSELETGEQVVRWDLLKIEGSAMKTVLDGELVFEKLTANDARNYTFWSCNQPFVDRAQNVRKDVSGIYSWFSDTLRTLQPRVVIGLGDAVYADSDNSVNIVKIYQNQVRRKSYDKDEIGDLYKLNYIAHWSIHDFSAILKTHPHIFTPDDHEYYDGYGSEPQADAKLERLFSAGRLAAEEFILSGGPRFRKGLHAEAHQFFVEEPAACFVFDSRESRHYKRSIMSERQLKDFTEFLAKTEQNQNVRLLILSVSVPLVFLRKGWEDFLAQVPDFVQDVFHFRDDVRDSWSSPGNIEYLRILFELLRKLDSNRPDLQIVLISGDIHVANAFSFKPRGFQRSLYQITSSSLCNPHHLPSFIRSVVAIPKGKYKEWNLYGTIRRLWEDVDKPNFLQCRVDGEGVVFILHVYDEESPMEKKLEILF